MQTALEAAAQLASFPKAVVDVYCLVRAAPLLCAICVLGAGVGVGDHIWCVVRATPCCV